MSDDKCYVPKLYAGKWYVFCTVTKWMGPHYDTEDEAKDACRHKNVAPKPGPGNYVSEMR